MVSGVSSWPGRWRRKPAEAQDEIDGLVKMYEAIGPGDEARKLDFDRQWAKLSEEKRSELVKRLLALGLLPNRSVMLWRFSTGKSSVLYENLNDLGYFRRR